MRILFFFLLYAIRANKGTATGGIVPGHHHHHHDTANISSMSDSAYTDLVFLSTWNGYEPSVRPICGEWPAQVTARIHMSLRHIMDVQEQKQIIWLNIWLGVEWTDCRLTWNPVSFGGVKRITVPSHSVWVPDVSLYDSAEEKTQDDYRRSRVNVIHDGRMIKRAALTIKSMCPINVFIFPFDTQVCNLSFGSWTYMAQELTVIPTENNAGDLQQYMEHCEWDLLNLSVISHSVQFTKGNFTMVVFNIRLKRKPLFFVVNLVCAGIITKGVAVVGFLLPPESGEKINLEITVLLSLSVFQLLIIEHMPASSDNMPVCSSYFLISMVLVAFSCVLAVMVLNAHFTSHHSSLPSLFKGMLYGRLGRCLGMETHITARKRKVIEVRKSWAQQSLVQPPLVRKSVGTNDRRLPKGPDAGSFTIVGGNDTNYNASERDEFDTAIQSPDSSQDGSVRRVVFIEPAPTIKSMFAPTMVLTGHTHNLTDTETPEEFIDMSEWRVFAILLDRIFFFLSLLLEVVTYLIVFVTIITNN